MNTSNSPKKWLAPCCILCGALLTASAPLQAQVYNAMVKPNETQTHLASFKGFSNAWRAVPDSLAEQKDDVPASERARRDAFFDARVGSQRSLLSNDPKGQVFPEGQSAHIVPSLQPELPEPTADMVWAIGAFSGHKTFLSKSERSIYTEIEIVPTRIFAQNRQPSPLIIAFPGGTVQTSNGAVVSYGIQPEGNTLQPGGTYLLRLRGYPEGFFTVQDIWNLANGKAIPMTEIGKYYGSGGKAQIANRSESDIVKLLAEKYGIQ